MCRGNKQPLSASSLFIIGPLRRLIREDHIDFPGITSAHVDDIKRASGAWVTRSGGLSLALVSGG